MRIHLRAKAAEDSRSPRRFANIPITGTLSADGNTITGTVTQGEVYTYVVTRN